VIIVAQALSLRASPSTSRFSTGIADPSSYHAPLARLAARTAAVDYRNFEPLVRL